MTELQIELPIKLNNVFITRGVVNQLDLLQTNCSKDCDKPNIDNGGITDYIAFLNELSEYFMSIIAYAALTEDMSKENKLLIELYWLKNVFSDFKIPDELIKELNNGK